jgi:hypothetical protein
VEGLGEHLELGARLVGPVPLQPQHLLELLGVLLGQPPRQLHHLHPGPGQARAPRPTLRGRPKLRHWRSSKGSCTPALGQQTHLWL